jgi:4-hydroxy-4-methyl-2-oxoglutarate aldolase
VVVADDDGVAIVGREQVDAVLAAVRARLAREDETRARLASGELGVDLYGFRQKLEDMGVRWIDTPEQ